MTLALLGRWRKAGISALTVTALALAGCGGGSPTITALPPAPSPAPTSPSAPALSLHGFVAVGRPVAGAALTVKCSNGRTYTSASDGSGAYVVAVEAGALPCVLESSGGTVAGVTYTTKLHSVALAAGTINVTPLTDLAVAAFARSSATAYFAGLFDAAAWARLTVMALQSAEALVIANLQALALSVPAADFFTGTFTPVAGDVYDALLAALAAQTAAVLQLLADSVIGGVVGKYPIAPTGVLLVPSMAGTWNTSDTRINRLLGNQVSGVAVGDRCRIDVTPGGAITVTTGSQSWTGQVQPGGSNGTVDAQYAPYHYTGYAPGNAGVQIAWGYFGQSFSVFSDQTPMSTTVRLNGSDALFCANYRYS